MTDTDGVGDSMRGIMIDAPETQDRDDAIWVRHTEAGFDAWVHIAMVASHLPADGAGDTQARRRMHTRYLPDHIVKMLPSAVEDAATLRAGVGNDTLCAAMRFTDEGELYECEVSAGRLEQPIAMSYEMAAQTLDDPMAADHQTVIDAQALSGVLLGRRQRAGALAFYDLFKGYATNEEGQLVRLGDNQRNSGYLIVQEFMIAANSAIATWCAARDLPMLFRNHRGAAVAASRDELLHELTDAQTRADGTGYELLRRRMGIVQRSATYDATVSGHYGLNLPVYAHTTSPLRRYADLVNQRIVLAAVTGTLNPYDGAQLESIAEQLNAGIQAERERRSERHRQSARRVTRARLADAEFQALDAPEFSKVLRLGLQQDAPAEILASEAERRFVSGELPLRDACDVLFQAKGDGWSRLRDEINRYLSSEPSKAVTVVSMYAQSIIGGPLNESSLQWNIVPVGTPHQPCFEAQLQLNLGQELHESSTRLQSSKKDAKSQAALALIAQLTKLEDLSSSTDRPDPQAAETTLIDRIPADRNPVMAVNEYTQLGAISDVSWKYDRCGPAHNPEYTCTVTGLAADSVEVEASGVGAGKQAAKTAAAAQLRHLIEDKLA